MHNSSLIEIFKRLTNKEIKSFFLYLESPLQDKGRYKKEALALLKILVKCAPDFEGEKIEKKNVYAKVFDNEPFKPGRLEKVMGELFKSLRLFLLAEKYITEDNEVDLQIDFAQILVDKGLSHRALNIIGATYEDLKAGSDTNSHKQRYKLSILEYEINMQRNRWKDDLNIIQTLRHLDLYYFSARINLLNHYLLLSKRAKFDSPIDLEAELKIHQLLNIVPDESPSLFISLKIFQLYINQKPDVHLFTELFDLLKSYEGIAGVGDMKQFYAYLRNYCAFLILDGNYVLMPVAHQINVDNLGKGYFYHDGYITAGAYLTISNVALIVGAQAWAEKFIADHQNMILGENESKDYYRTTYSNFLLHCKKYQEALDTVPAASEHLELHLFGRRIELKACYELKSDLLYYKIDAFKMYISRASKKTISKELSEMNSNFINLLHQIAYSTPGDSQRGEKIIQRINAKKLLHDREWLLEKARELS